MASIFGKMRCAITGGCEENAAEARIAILEAKVRLLSNSALLSVPLTTHCRHCGKAWQATVYAASLSRRLVA